MAEELDQTFPRGEGSENLPRRRRRGRRRWAAFAVFAVLSLILLLLWSNRNGIADDVIADQLKSLGLPATYKIERISPSEQIVSHLVIGDPRRPDLTIDEVHVRTRLAWGIPGIGRITLIRPRLFGVVRDGKASFGSLDKVLFTGGKEPFRMPDLDVAIVDGRGLVDGDFGRVAMKVDGSGALRGGFSGVIAAISPRIVAAGCETGPVTIYGKLSIGDEQPRFKGPIRLTSAKCRESGLIAAKAEAELDAKFNKPLDGGKADLAIKGGALRYGSSRLAGVGGTAAFSLHDGLMAARYDLALQDLATPNAKMADLQLRGQVRSTAGGQQVTVDGDVTGSGIAPAQDLARQLDGYAAQAKGTFAEPLLRQLGSALSREAGNASFIGTVLARRKDAGWSVNVPSATLRGRSGAALLAVSRFSVTPGVAGAAMRFAGGFATGGQGLPKLTGKLRSDGTGRLALDLVLPEYRAGPSRIAMPQMTVMREADGMLAFNGAARLTGALPGGWAENLAMPVDGRMTANGDFRIWPGCASAAFDHLAFANLKLDAHRLSVCPAAGRAIVQRSGGVLAVSAGVPSLDLSGHLGETPIRIASGPVGYAMAGGGAGSLGARKLVVSLGPREGASHFAIPTIDARIGDGIDGAFADAEIALFSVPLDLRQTSGRWSYRDGVFGVEHGAFTLVDRQQVARFQPLSARDATLTLQDGRILAHALLREPRTDREVAAADIAHDLNRTEGHADLKVAGIVFDDKLQAADLSRLMLGVVSNLRGTLDGAGRIDWTEAGVTSSGEFQSDGLDLAAPFGPVQGISGTVVFTDLLGMVTAPDQKLRLASMNPGVEVTDGVLSYEMKPGFVLQINGATWPFMDGKLILEPAVMRMGIDETRHYTLAVTGLNATTFINHLQLENILASGVFDGRLPLVFDKDGGRIEDGYLRSRDPGGNVSYVGALTYKDLSAMGNYAFGVLRSINYRKMDIGLNGSLSGEILTKISFDGLSQGQGATRNFITKQIAKLPIRFVLNIKAPFFSLFGSMRALYDPAYVTDPRQLGLNVGNGAGPANPAKPKGANP